MDKISIIVPCYNEEESLPLFYKEISKIADIMKEKVKFEFLFINDGSVDNTIKLLREYSKKDKRVKYVSFSRNFGKESAMFAGLENAIGDYIAIMDADLQDPPELLPEMYEMIKNSEYDCIATKSTSRNGYSNIRKILTKCYYKIINSISKIEMVAGARDYRLMSRQMVDAILKVKEYNRYIKGLYGFVGFDTKWIEFENKKRVAGKTKWSIKKLFGYAFEAIISFSTVPLTISAILGILFCIGSFIAIMVIIIKTLCFGDPTNGWPSLVCIMFFLSGIQLFCIGIIGAYLSKTYLETKKRPIYIVKETNK